MKSLNRATLLGCLGKDVDLTYTQSGVACAKFSLATNYRYKGKDDEYVDITDWFNIVCWKNLAEIAGKYLHKGSKVYLEGKIKTRSYEKEGVTHYVTEIIPDEIIMLDGKGSENESDGEPKSKKEGWPKPNPAPKTQVKSGSPDTAQTGGTAQSSKPTKKEIDDICDSIPF